MEKRQTFSERFDWTLCLILFLFLIVSLISIYAAQASGQHTVNFAVQQIMWYIIGAVIVAVIMYFDPDQIKRMSWYLFGFGILLLIILYLAPDGKGQIAEPINGAKSWFRIPFASIQPSEFVKIFLILALSKMTVQHNQANVHKNVKTDFMLFLKLAALTSLPLALVMLRLTSELALLLFPSFWGLSWSPGLHGKSLCRSLVAQHFWEG